MKGFSAGTDTDAHCNKCKLLLAHVIHAVGRDGKPAKVECKTCGSIHAYKDPKKKKPRARAKTKRVTKPKIPKMTEYERLMKGRNVDDARKYDLKEVFAVKELIAHPKFGCGLVTGVHPKYVHVLFSDGSKRLVHDY